MSSSSRRSSMASSEGWGDGESGSDSEQKKEDRKLTKVERFARCQERGWPKKNPRRRAVSPIYPGNHVPNPAVAKGGFFLPAAAGKVSSEQGGSGKSAPGIGLGAEQSFKVPTDEEKYFEDIERLRRLMQEASGLADDRARAEFEQTQRQEVLASLYVRCPTDDPEEKPMPHTKKFVYVDFGVYRSSQYVTMPAEFAIAEFSIADGITDCYSRMLDPRIIPLGYRGEVKDEMKKNGYLEPGFDPDFDWYKDCLRYIETYTERNKIDAKEPAYLYAMPNNIMKVKECITWIARSLGLEFRFKVVPFTVLVHVLLTEASYLRHANRLPSGHINLSAIEVFRQLTDGEYEYESSVACSFHQMPNRLHLVHQCSTNRLKCRIYNALNLLSRYYRCRRFVYNHFPKVESADYQVLSTEVKGPTIEQLNDDKSVTSTLSSCDTGKFLYRARGASTTSYSSSLTLSGYEGEDEEFQMQEEDALELRANYATLEKFPRMRQGGYQRESKFLHSPDMKEREFPKQKLPYLYVPGEAKKPEGKFCKSCAQDNCICSDRSVSSSDVQPSDRIAYKRFANPLLRKHKRPIVMTALGGETAKDEWESESVTSATALSGLEVSSVGTQDDKASINSNDSVLKSMKEAQKILPATGTLGRGYSKFVWAGQLGITPTLPPPGPSFVFGRGRGRGGGNQKIQFPNFDTNPGNPTNFQQPTATAAAVSAEPDDAAASGEEFSIASPLRRILAVFEDDASSFGGSTTCNEQSTSEQEL